MPDAHGFKKSSGSICFTRIRRIALDRFWGASPDLRVKRPCPPEATDNPGAPGRRARDAIGLSFSPCQLHPEPGEVVFGGAVAFGFLRGNLAAVLPEVIEGVHDLTHRRGVVEDEIGLLGEGQ